MQRQVQPANEEIQQTLRMMHGFANSISDGRSRVDFVGTICNMIGHAVKHEAAMPQSIREIEKEYFRAIGMNMQEYARFQAAMTTARMTMIPPNAAKQK
jgi:hypothetical protein